MPAVNLELHELQGPQERVRRTYSGGSLSAAGGGGYAVAGATTLDLVVSKDGTKYRIAGRLDATLQLACCRCLEPVRREVTVTLDLLYLPASEHAGDGDVRIEEPDLSAAYYRDGQIDLGQLMHEQFQLALPMKPLCRDDCRGLCAICGGNRNLSECGCVETWEDPRLAGLKSLLDR
jgi:uncharacterized protein